MKLILSFILFLPSILLAHQGFGYKIIAEKIVTTPNTKARTITMPIQPRNPNLPATSSTFLGSSGAKVDNDIEIRGEHYISIKNKSHKTEIFQYSQKLTIADQAMTNIRSIAIEPGGRFEDETHSSIILRIQKAGGYVIKASTEIKGLYNDYSDAITTLAIH